MKKITKDQIKTYIKEHREEITEWAIISGIVALFGTATYVVARSGKDEVYEEETNDEPALQYLPNGSSVAKLIDGTYLLIGPSSNVEA